MESYLRYLYQQRKKQNDIINRNEQIAKIFSLFEKFTLNITKDDRIILAIGRNKVTKKNMS